MKNISFIIVALAVVLGFWSCKKENMLEVNEMRVFPISADATDGSKAIVTPEGKVKFYMCDHLYVAYQGNNYGCSVVYKGNGENSFFNGPFNVPDNIQFTDSVPLHFFGLAGVSGKGVQDAYWTEEQLEYTTTATRTCISLQNLGKDSNGNMNMDDLILSMPYICFGVSKEPFPTKTNKYTVELYNKCAMVKYNVAAGIPYYKEIYIKGLNNVVDVDFSVPYYKFKDMNSELAQFTNNGYDDDGFRFFCGEGKIQTASLLTPGSDKVINVTDPKNLIIDGVIIIPYREEPKNEKDKTYCYSLLLPQKEVNELSCFYYDDNGKKVDLTIEIIDWNGEPAKEVVENWYYEINITTKEDS